MPCGHAAPPRPESPTSAAPGRTAQPRCEASLPPDSIWAWRRCVAPSNLLRDRIWVIMKTKAEGGSCRLTPWILNSRDSWLAPVCHGASLTQSRVSQKENNGRFCLFIQLMTRPDTWHFLLFLFYMQLYCLFSRLQWTYTLIVQTYKLQRKRKQIAYSNNNQRYLQFRLSYFINMYSLFYSEFFSICRLWKFLFWNILPHFLKWLHVDYHVDKIIPCWPGYRLYFWVYRLFPKRCYYK